MGYAFGVGESEKKIKFFALLAKPTIYGLINVEKHLVRRHLEMQRKYESMIQSNPAVMMGKPVIAGTRITVEVILEKLAAGETVEQILAAHPRLTQEAIRAALAFAADALRSDVVYPLAESRQ